MTLEYDVVVIGGYFFDQIYTGVPEFPVLGREICATGLTTTGGGMYITTTALHRLGVKVGWPVYFGDDYYSRFVRDVALEEGIDLSLAKVVPRPYRQVTTSIPYQGERAFLTYTDPDPVDLYDFWLESLDRCRFKHLHLGSLMKPEFTRRALDKARTQGATFSMDCQDGPHLAKPCNCRELLAQVDIFMPNARETLIVAEKHNLQEALRVLMDLAQIIVVKDGANGVWVGRDGHIIHVPAVAIGSAIDTTGAGDCFNAGFLRGYVLEHAALEVCAQYGTICGGYSVTGVGGATTAPTHEQLQSWLPRLAQPELV
jgi:sugar/nucleoside kinase (ribokinase family)